MKPFTITCTTCNARLKVRNESAVGDILSCPRCKSMVLVQPPSDSGSSELTSDSPSESMELLADSLDPLAGTDLATPASEDPPAGGTPVNESPTRGLEPAYDPLDPGWAETMPDVPVDQRAWQDAAAGSQTLKERWKEVAPDAQGERADDVASTPSEKDPLLPTDNWTTPATQRMGQWLLVGLAGLTGILLAVAVVAFMAFQAARRQPEGGDGVAVVNDPAGTDNPAPADTNDAPADSNGGIGAESAPPKTNTPDSPDSEPADPNTTPSDGVPPQPLPRLPSDPASPDTPDKPGAPNEPAVPPLPAGLPGEPSAPRPNGLPPVAPPPGTEPAPGVGTEQGPPGLSPAAAPASEDDVSADAVAGLLSRFAPLLSNTPFQAGGAESEEMVKDDAAPKPAVADAPPAPSVPVAVVRPERPAPRQIDVAARLAEPIVEITLEDTPLDGFLSFAGQFSTIPITIDVDALTRRKLSFQTPIRLTQSNTTLGNVLTAGLQSLGLRYVEEQGQLLIVEANTEPTEAVYPLEDLIAGQPARGGTIVQWARALVAPRTWQPGGTGNLQLRGESLVVNASPDVQFELLRFLDKLRVARKLETRSGYDPTQFQMPTRREQASVKLNEPFLLNFTQPTPLPRILDRMAESTGMRILVDWQALGRAGWSPEASLRFATDNRPLREALNGLLRPMDLTFRVIDADTLEVTTRDAQELRPELEMYPIDDLLTDDPDGRKLMDRIRDTFGPDVFGPQGTGVLQFDPESRCLLARLSQPRQLELFELLSQWRAEG